MQIPFDSGDVASQWARRFIDRLANGEDDLRHDLSDLSPEQHEALAEVVSDALRSRSSKVRRSAAWVTGALDVIPDDAPARLAKLLHDRVALVRMAAAWACGDLDDAGAETVPNLIAALNDPNSGVRFAAVASLRKLGELAADAVQPLLAVAETGVSEKIRTMALLALGDIAPNDPSVRDLLRKTLESPSNDQRFAAAYGCAQAKDGSTNLLNRLTANLRSQDRYLAFISAWAIGRLSEQSPDASVRLLEGLKRLHWLQIEHSEIPDKEYISVRPVIREALEHTLPPTEDAKYQDFRLKFFMHVFRPAPPEDNKWIDELVTHPWYLKIQRRRFGRPADAQQRQAIGEMVQEAQTKFALRMQKNPTLGVRLYNFMELPGFMKYHARNIAWRLRQQREKASRQRPSGGLSGSSREIDQEPAAQLSDLPAFIEAALSDEEREVARSLWVLDLSIRATAKMLGLTPSKVRTREKNARAKAQALLK